MKILSLFDGMACGHIAFDELNIPIERYVAFEIDKYAIKVATHNFPDIEERGDVFDADFTEFEGFDWLIGGSPCTYWSIAQKNNRETEASGMGWELFSQYVRALHEAKPKYFLYENNKSMSKAIRASITETFGFEPICINSALVSAQNRQRLYWVGIRQEDGTYRKADIEQPVDRGIVLKDILQTGCDLTCNDKSFAYTTRCNGAIPEDTIAKHRRSMVAEPIRIPPYGKDDKSRPIGATYSNHAGTGEGSLEQRMFSPNPNKKQVDLIAEPINTTSDGKASTVMAGYYKYGTATMITNDGFKGGANGVAEPVNVTDEGKSQTIKAQYQQTSPRNICCYTSTFGASGVAEPIRVGALPRPNGELSTSQAMRVYSADGKPVNLTSGGGGMGGKTGLYAIPVEFDGDIPTKAISLADGKEHDVYSVKDGQITIKGKQYPIKLIDGYYIIRKLTVTECMRLQTVPEWYQFKDVISDSQAYKCLGNGWTVEVIKHLIGETLK